MTGLLGLALPPWLNPSIIAAVGIGLASSAATGLAVHHWDAGALANSRTETAEAITQYEAYKGLVASRAATATAVALEQKQSLEAQVDRLQADLLKQQGLTDAKSKALRDLLNSAKPGDLRAIGPVSSAYYDRLRLEAGRSAGP